MNKITTFLGKNFEVIVLVLLTLVFLNTCGSGDIKKINKRLDALTEKVDSLESIIVTKRELQIEGLKVEKRMIQSTDRKIIDVNRQSEIDKQIQELSK